MTLVWLKYSSGGLLSHCFYGETDKPAIISQQTSSLGSVQKTDVLTSASGPQRHHALAEVSSHVKCTVKAHYAFLWRLFCRTESKFMIRSHFTAVVPGQIVSGVNFNFFCFCSQPQISFFSANLLSTVFASSLRPCPIKIWSPGHFVLLGTQKVCNTEWTRGQGPPQF